MEPKLPMAHQALGYYLSRKNDLEKADVQAKEAIAEGDASFGAAYLHGMLLARLGAMGDNHKEAVDALKKATELNPKFAPAFEALAYVYGQSPEEQKQALEAVIAAVKLDPAQHRYLFHLANLMVANGRDADAQHLAQKIVANANSSEEKAEAEALSKRIQEHADWMAANQSRQVFSRGSGDADKTAGDNRASTPTGSGGPQSPTSMPLAQRTIMSVEGQVHEVACDNVPELVLSLNFSGSILLLHSANLEMAEVTAAKGQSAMSGNCHDWVGHRVKVWFHLNQGEKYFGEITKLYFY